MKRLFFLSIIISLFSLFPSLRDSDAAQMEDYCQIPPYVIQNVPPNVMIVLDNSGSMFNFSYFDGFNTTDIADDNLCATIGSPCTGFTTPGTYPTYKYYGYFNPNYWYEYTANKRFVPTAPKTGSGITGARDKLPTEWDGNFLNWLTMRRIDIIRKVMTGGKYTGTGLSTRLRGEIADCPKRGRYKRIANANLYTPYSGTRKIYVSPSTGTCNGSGSGTSSFSVRNAPDGGDGTGNEATFNVEVIVALPGQTASQVKVEGVLKSVVGAKARLGLSFYNTNNPTPQGGFVRVYISGGSLSSTVNEINLTRPSANTPLAETLWTVAGYFAQQATLEGGPGPRYSGGNYQINNNVDPYNYGTGGQPRYPACAKSFVLYITDGEPCADGYLPSTIANYADGKSDYNCSGDSCPAVGPFPASTFPSCSAGGNVAGIEDVALWANTTDLRPDIPGKQTLTLYSVFAFGKGSTLLRYAAINGGFEDINGNNIPDLQSEWDNNGDNEPDTFYEATDGAELEQSIRDAFSSILKRAASGTAASVLASGEGQGANLIQAVFYPRRRFGNDIISWTGSMQNLWFYLDPDLQCTNIREDTNPDKILHLQDDYITQLYFDTDAEETRARRWEDADGDGCVNDQKATVAFENLLNLWEAGKLLWERDITADPRTIYTTINGTSFLSGNFTTSNASTLRPYLNVADDDLAEDIIKYIHGEGLTTLKDQDGNILIAGIDRDGDGWDDYRARYATIGSDTNVWKLGDILNSTPRIASWIPLNEYHRAYKDSTYGPTDPDLIKELNLNKLNCPNCYYLTTTGTTGYVNRGMVFAGGNDGMLHAFKLGKLELKWSGQGTFEKARLTGSDLGKELWAFIPKNVLPYLKYFAQPDYCHVYTVDLPPYIFDASIGEPGSGDVSNDTKEVSHWRTILIGGMRIGGACRNTGDACTDCVKTPIDNVGFSSYFALDITDQNNPTLLWEFSDPNLGFATTGPAVVKIVPDTTLNGKWFVVFGSGPTGPINTTEWQFIGRSDQNLRFFVLDLKTGNLEGTINTGINYAFAGSMINSTYDHKLANYSDDAIYVGYVKRTGAGTAANPYTWTEGGVGRLVLHDPDTKEETDDVTKWEWKPLMDNIGPVTSSITHLYHKNNKIAWLFFGAGRYYYELSSNTESDPKKATDDAIGERRIFGIKEPCVTAEGAFDFSSKGCPTTTVAFGDLTNVTSIDDVPDEEETRDPAFKGWYINLDSCTDSSENTVSCTSTNPPPFYWTERTITDPVASPSTGAVFYTTYKPYNDECGIGGKTHLWALKYSTGGEVASLLKGKALLQVSTAAIEEVQLSTAFTERGGRRTTGMEGVPPTSQGLVVIGQPKPVKRVIHMRER